MGAPGVMREHVAPRRLAKRRPQMRIVDETRQPARQRVGIARRHHPRRLAVAKHLADLIEIRRDDGFAHGHVLEQLGRRAEKRRAVGVRHVRRRQDVAGREVPRPVFLRNQAREVTSVVETGGATIRLDAASPGPLPIISRRTESRYAG